MFFGSSFFLLIPRQAAVLTSLQGVAALGVSVPAGCVTHLIKSTRGWQNFFLSVSLWAHRLTLTAMFYCCFCRLVSYWDQNDPSWLWIVFDTYVYFKHFKFRIEGISPFSVSKGDLNYCFSFSPQTPVEQRQVMNCQKTASRIRHV